jgi:hypothetical protein
LDSSKGTNPQFALFSPPHFLFSDNFLLFMQPLKHFPSNRPKTHYPDHF